MTELFDPLYQISIPHERLAKLAASSLPNGQLVPQFTAIAAEIAQWLETAHLIAFTIEQNVKKADSETYTVEPLEKACAKMQPVIQLLAECCDEQEELGSNLACRLTLTKIQSEWSGLQHFISSLKALIETSNERHMLRTLMETILVQIDDLSTMIFQFQEQRYRAAPNEEKDRILMEIDQRVGPLFHHVEKVYTRMTSATPVDDSSGLLTRKHVLVQERWECLRIEIDELKIELKEDRWLLVFRQVADQVDDMITKLERSMDYKHYVPSIAKMLSMLGNGISARVSKDTTTIQRHEAMLTRWNKLKQRAASPSVHSREYFISSRQASPDQDMITTKDFKHQRSVTPNLQRSGIPRPASTTRPRSSMARIPVPKYRSGSREW